MASQADTYGPSTLQRHWHTSVHHVADGWLSSGLDFHSHCRCADGAVMHLGTMSDRSVLYCARSRMRGAAADVRTPRAVPQVRQGYRRAQLDSIPSRVGEDITGRALPICVYVAEIYGWLRVSFASETGKYDCKGESCIHMSAMCTVRYEKPQMSHPLNSQGLQPTAA